MTLVLTARQIESVRRLVPLLGVVGRRNGSTKLAAIKDLLAGIERNDLYFACVDLIRILDRLGDASVTVAVTENPQESP